MHPKLARLFDLTGRVALVTGGSSGIGNAIAWALAAAGARGVLLARDNDRLEKAASALSFDGFDVATLACDVGDAVAVEAAVTAAAAPFGPIDILVNAAGVNIRKPFDSLTDDDWNATLAVNLAAPFRLTRGLAPAMAERGWGRIVNVASQQAVRAFGMSGVYGVSKGGLVSLTRSIAEQWSAAGVTCNAIVPGFVLTPLTAAASSDPARVAAMSARTMIGRNGVPDDFIGIAVYLASDASAAVTGQTIFVDGGFSAA
jgi:NAD(P)-dependent dehydrogenase (short-subunit alcohol dehydrogenase family)